MFAKIWAGRKTSRSCKLRRRCHYQLRAEQLEKRLLLAHGGGAAALEFETVLASLDLAGGPYAMPLAHDPGNELGDSIAGYGFVDSRVNITLSSQRPGNQDLESIGTSRAFLELQDGNNAVAPNGGAGLDEVLGGAELAAIHPAELDGHEFFVDSTWDVFFDISVTDVDSREGRDFAGRSDGATIELLDNGPASMQTLYTTVFDADAPNFGLVPPPEAAPYTGDLSIEIPLGADLNGNGENDKIKFSLASAALSDADRTFSQLPDGTVINEFDTATFLEGAVVDESSDPPFTLGAGSLTAPAFSGPGALTGPTTVMSTLSNPVAGATFSFVDADNDKLFTAGTDVALIHGEVADGEFDTRLPEGGYHSVIAGAGLYLGGDPIVAHDVDFRADGTLVVNTDVSAENVRGGDDERDQGRDIHLMSRSADVFFDDPAVNADRDIELDAAGNVISTDDLLVAHRDVEVTAGGLIHMDGTIVEAGKNLELEGGEVDVGGSMLTAHKNLEIKSASDIRAEGVGLFAHKKVELEAVDSIFAAMAMIEAGKAVEMQAGADIDLAAATVFARKEIEIKSAGDVSLVDARLEARKKIEIEGETIDQTDAVLTARRIEIEESLS